MNTPLPSGQKAIEIRPLLLGKQHMRHDSPLKPIERALLLGGPVERALLIGNQL